jgi:hypothetical protein
MMGFNTLRQHMAAENLEGRYFACIFRRFVGPALLRSYAES